MFKLRIQVVVNYCIKGKRLLGVPQCPSVLQASLANADRVPKPLPCVSIVHIERYVHNTSPVAWCCMQLINRLH
jgi:hypothetical protein